VICNAVWMKNCLPAQTGAARALWPHLAAYRSGCDACERELLDTFLIGAPLFAFRYWKQN
jgi:hypothetical protein